MVFAPVVDILKQDQKRKKGEGIEQSREFEKVSKVVTGQTKPKEREGRYAPRKVVGQGGLD